MSVAIFVSLEHQNLSKLRNKTPRIFTVHQIANFNHIRKLLKYYKDRINSLEVISDSLFIARILYGNAKKWFP